MNGHSLRLALRTTMLASAAVCTLASGCGSTPPEPTDDVSDLSEEEEQTSENADDSAEPEEKDEPVKKPVQRDAGPDGASKPTPRPETAKPIDPKTSGTPGVRTDFCDALAVMKDKCADCHDGEGSGPMKLLTYEDFIADAPLTKGKKVHEVVKTRIHDTKKPMPPTPLEAAELAVLDKWLDGGAIAGENPKCEGLESEEAAEPAKPWPPPGAEKCAKLVAYSGTPADGVKATVAKNTEPHPQFIFDAPWGDQKVHGIGFKPILDTKKVLHHWILYPNSGGVLSGMLTGWAPGGENAKAKPLPEDVGVVMPSGPKSLRLDMHYWNLGEDTKDEQDASGVEVCWTTKLRKHGAATFMQFGNIVIDIPPGQTKDVIGRCTVQTSDNQPVYLLSVSAHAHTYAKHMKFTVERKEGMTETLYDAPFLFEEQQRKGFDEPLALRPGDTVVTNCTFKNDTEKRITFGENTGNEMCFNFATYYPSPNLSCAFGTGIVGLGSALGLPF